MMIKASILLLVAAAAPPPPQGAPPPSVAAFAGLFTPWSAAERDSRAAEERTRTAEAPPPADAERRRVEAVARGERVGEIVRAGDCEEGERIARAAADFALVRAVRDHCRSAPAR